MKVSLVLTILLLLVVAWFVIQSVVMIFKEFSSSHSDHPRKLQTPSRTDSF
jgi:hypothetical protein